MTVIPDRRERITRLQLIRAESSLRDAGRSLEFVGVMDPELDRLARVVFRLAQRVAVDAGRLEPAA